MVSVRTSALVTLGVGWGLLRAGYRLRPGAVAVVESAVRGGRRSGPGSTHPSDGPESHGEPVSCLFPC